VRRYRDQHATQFIDALISSASSAVAFPTPFSPDFIQGSYNHERRADGWAASRGLDVEWEERKGPARVLDLEVGLDGGGRLFCGRAAEEYQDRLLIIDVLVAGLTARFLAVMGGLYAKGDYLGQVDVGLAVTGLRGGISYIMSRQIGSTPTPYDKDQYRRTDRFLASALSSDPRGAASKLV
jgi:hypothetical protein